MWCTGCNLADIYYAAILQCLLDHFQDLTMVCVQIPTVGFLYIAGYIGYVGRDYIKQVKNEKKPTEKEIIIDVPFAIKLAFRVWDGHSEPFRSCAQEL